MRELQFNSVQFLTEMTRFKDNTWTPAINVTCWFLMVVAILGIIVRLGTKAWIYRKFTPDDYVIILSIVSNGKFC
jgi:hypothetical protein